MKETIEGNKIIASFLSKQTGRKVTTTPTRMNYHSNWNSLMTVRDEVKKMGAKVIINDSCTVESTGYSKATNIEGNTERQNVWAAMVGFISSIKAAKTTTVPQSQDLAQVETEG